MKSLKCKNCGGAMVLDASMMTAVCHYCGVKYVLNHEDTDYYRDFFRQMNEFLAGSDDEKARKRRADALWERADEKTFVCADGNEIEIRYMHCHSNRDTDVYTARRNIVFHFREDGAARADRFRRNVTMLDYPSADTRKLSDFFPKVTGGFVLDDGSYLLVIEKNEDEYPLRLFGHLSGRHTAWVISRMENLCCVLEYNTLVHPEIGPDTLYINPYTHQAALYGGWEQAGRKNTGTSDGRSVLRMAQNLEGIRQTAAELLGFSSASEVRESAEIPAALAEFISGRPRADAYDDFALWDEMLIQAYGERKFVRMDTDDGQVYGR